MEKQKRNFKQQLIYWVMLNVGTLLLAVGIYFFKSTNHFVTGGVTGIAILLTMIPGFPLQQSVVVMIINVLLLVVGFIVLGKACLAKTFYCTIVYSLENFLFEQLIPLDAPLTNEPLLELVYAILLTGIGAAIVFNCGASSGGTDIVALILKKYSKMDVGKALLVSDLIVVVASFFLSNVQLGLYNLLGLFSKAFLIDGIIEAIGKSKYLTIITTKPEAIGKFILENMRHGYTKHQAEGGFTHEEKTILITICRRGEAYRLKKFVNQVDPEAFTIITDANEILGKGFRETLD